MDSDSQYQIYQIMLQKGWSPQKINDMLYKLDVCADRAEHVQTKLRHKRVFGNKPTCLITISFDQSMSALDTIQEMRNFIKSFKESDYKWCENVVYSMEFFSSKGWNPHIHIVTEKNDSPSIIKKAIKRSPAFKKANAYTVDIKVGNDSYHYKYIEGDKKEEKQENCGLDNEFRETHKLKSHYNL